MTDERFPAVCLWLQMPRSASSPSPARSSAAAGDLSGRRSGWPGSPTAAPSPRPPPSLAASGAGCCPTGPCCPSPGGRACGPARARDSAASEAAPVGMVNLKNESVYTDSHLIAGHIPSYVLSTFWSAGGPVLQLPIAIATLATLEYLPEKSLSTIGWETGYEKSE